jgi:hypothetical protein
MDILPPVLARCVHRPELDDELPPWLGERFRDITHDIHRAAFEAQQDEEPTNGHQ